MTKTVVIPLRTASKKFKEMQGLYIASLIEKYGDFFLANFKFMGMSLLKAHMLFNPTSLKYVLYDNYENYIRSPLGIENAKRVIGDKSLLTMDYGELWKNERELLNPVLSENGIKNYADIMIDNMENIFDSWEEFYLNKKPINLETAVETITFTNLKKTLFGGINIDNTSSIQFLNEVDSLISASSKYLGVITSPFHLQRIKKAAYRIEKLADRIIQQTLAPNSNNNLIKIINNYHINKKINDNDLKKILRAEASLILSAGFQTVSTLLVWALAYLSLYPTQYQKLRNEVQDVLGDKKPTYSDIAKLTYTKAFLQETLRIQPPFPFMLKTAVNDDKIGQHLIKKGDIVFISMYNVNRMIPYWPNPEGFDPERFLQPLDEQHKFVYLPFSIGPRSCIGQHYALMQSILFLAMLTQRYHLWLTPDSSLCIEKKSSFNKLNSKVHMTVNKPQ